jgi:tmRNA-binding protein
MRNNTNAKEQTTIAKASKASSEYQTMEALCGGLEYTGTVGCRAATYSTSSGSMSGCSFEK